MALSRCGHQFHSPCLKQWFQKIARCPVCNDACGKLLGSGPKVGTLSWKQIDTQLPGFSRWNTIQLCMMFPPGIDDDGQSYLGRSEVAYLPNNEQGKMLLRLFIVAFKRRLLFGLGHSLSRGTRMPIFNIHLKTRVLGGAARHGYPDDSYIDRTFQELSGYGICVESAPWIGIGEAKPTCDKCGDEILGVACFLHGRPYHFGCGPQVMPESDQCDSAVSTQASLAQHSCGADAGSLGRVADRNGEGEAADDCGIPCDICGNLVPFERYEAHISMHGTGVSNSARGTDSSLIEAVEREQLSIPCEICGKHVAVEQYQAHVDSHSDASADAVVVVPCEVCGEEVPWSQYSTHVAAHREQQQAREQSRLALSCEPAEVALQLVALVRREADLIDGGRDICNFDVADGFVRQMHAFGGDGDFPKATAEIVYHWTREENLSSIIDVNLRVAGEPAQDGSRIPRAHGAAHGSGIYAAADIAFGARYGHGATEALLCLALPGNVLTAGKLHEGYDSLRKGNLRVYRSSSQLLPLFLTTIEKNTAAQQAAERVSQFLRDRFPIRWTYSHAKW
eukprot:TRINITY_DN29063_c0_g1_i1.p1 TRINITY_DN29063_c0_g1~~TRINITY_DN29063_c0_g1_i1.p1  ORF type:complete len:653 (+),score=115.54 TRINITY_DN29063_c0_g1_i1:268-1959(+)